MRNIVFGRSGEDYAEKLLLGLGYKILAKNFRTKIGEIDIVALREDELNFVEVKTRSSGKFGKPEEAVTPRKIRTIARVGELFNRMYPVNRRKMKILVVAIETENGYIKSSKLIPAV